jgi:ubiquinol-cytochrome c reductase cytochrome b subunit
MHFILPFILLTLTVAHLSLLHVEGSSSPIGIEHFDYVNFYPYFIVKDLLSFVLILAFLYVYLVMFNPNLLGDSLNYVPANKIKTPIHIVPEWYFLPFYCMLRCIHHKVLGILCMGASIVVIAILAIYPNSVFPAKFDIIHSIFFILFVVTCFNLCFLATQHMTDYIIMYSRI